MPGGRFTIGQVAEGAATNQRRRRRRRQRDRQSAASAGLGVGQLTPALGGSSACSHRWATATTDSTFLSERRPHHRRELFDEEGLGQEVIHPGRQRTLLDLAGRMRSRIVSTLLSSSTKRIVGFIGALLVTIPLDQRNEAIEIERFE
jgi:hypothetical protein